LKRRLFAMFAVLAAAVAPGVAEEAPRRAPEFVVRLANGQQVLLSQFRGKVVALEFLHTTCVHCQNCSVLMNKLYREYGAKGFQPLGVAFNDFAPMLVSDYVKQLGLTFPVGAGNRDEVLSFLQHPIMQLLRVPQLVLIDREGMIRAQMEGEEDEAHFRAQIESLLKASPSPRKGAK
jgi:peroxiredoxin